MLHIEDPESDGIKEAVAFVADHFAEPITLADLSKATGVPENTLTRRFNRAFGLSPVRWVWYFRTLLAAEMIAAMPGTSLTQIALYCGFNSSAHFSRRFRESFAMMPSKYQRAHRAVTRNFLHRVTADGALDGLFLTNNQKIFVARVISKIPVRGTHSSAAIPPDRLV